MVAADSIGPQLLTAFRGKFDPTRSVCFGRLRALHFKIDTLSIHRVIDEEQNVFETVEGRDENISGVQGPELQHQANVEEFKTVLPPGAGRKELEPAIRSSRLSG